MQVLVKVSLCESVLSERQTRVFVEPELALGCGSMAGEQPLIKVFLFAFQTAWEKMV